MNYSRNRMKKLSVLLVMPLVLSWMSPAMAEGGFNEWGYNYTAHLFNGWYGQWGEWKTYHGLPPGEHWSGATWNAWIVMKWSKNWVPEEDEPIGAWVTNHWTWYSNDYDEETWYGWDTRVEWTDKDVAPEALYMVTEFLKVQKVSNDTEAWERYQTGGAYDAGWGSYENGVPKYVVFQDVISVYDTSTGELVATFNLCTASPKGVGKPIF
jgi:hypothetical protein